MAEGTRVQFPTAAAWAIGGFFAVSALLAPALRALDEPAGGDPTNPEIELTARGPVMAWCCCWPLAFMGLRDVRGLGAPRRFGIRLAWSRGCVLLWLHVAVAFHLGHGWSPAAAWRHTQQAGGFGDGIYVNYAVMLVWLADALWLCAAFDAYFARPRWLHWTVHGFIAFVVFNAAVVFAGWNIRALTASVFLITLSVFVLRRRANAATRPSAE
jgi:hypothetical protein